MLAKSIVEELREIVGPENVSNSATICEAYAFVASGQDMLVGQRPDIVVLPLSVKQISAIIKLANKNRIPVVIRGQGTGLLGENVALKGGILLDMSLMNKIIDVNEENMVTTVEAGCSVLKLYYELDKKDLTFPIRSWFTPNMHIGGYVANNGTGDYSNTYGRVGENVVGLEVVLPTGEIVRLGSWANPKGYGAWTRFPGGPDLVGLFTGSIGTLGVITKVALRVINKRRFISYRTFGWPNNRIDDLSKAIYYLQRYKVSNISLHNYWVMRGPIRAGMIELPSNIYFVLNLMQEAESQKSLEVMESIIIKTCEKFGGVDLGTKICKLYHGPPYYLINLGQFYRFYPKTKGFAFVMFYHCCPTRKFPEYWSTFESIVDKYGFLDESRGPYLYAWGLTPALLNPFPTFAYRPEDPEEVKKMREAYEEISQSLMEKGVVPYTIGSFQPKQALTNLGSAYALLKSIKNLLDPNNILNPGQL